MRDQGIPAKFQMKATFAPLSLSTLAASHLCPVMWIERVSIQWKVEQVHNNKGRANNDSNNNKVVVAATQQSPQQVYKGRGRERK